MRGLYATNSTTVPLFPVVSFTRPVAAERFQTMLDVETIRYLEDLAGKGTHGSSVPAVGRKLMQEGVRIAIKENFIKLRG